jgi:hypothetical protein
MKWVILGLAVAGVIFLVLGCYVNRTGRSADESLGAVIPWLFGITILGVDLVLLVGFVIYKAFST